jgi:hypothetical protein
METCSARRKGLPTSATDERDLLKVGFEIANANATPSVT